MLNKQYYVEKAKVDRLVARKNTKADFYNGIYDRYEYPVLTREFAPVHWRYDLDEETNPYFMERLGINAVMNSGAIELNAVQRSNPEMQKRVYNAIRRDLSEWKVLSRCPRGGQ